MDSAQVNAAAAARLLSRKGGAAVSQPAADSDDEEVVVEGDSLPADGQPAAKRQRRAQANPLTDDRFASMFRDRDFEIDMESEEYKLLHPNAGAESQWLGSCPLESVQRQKIAWVANSLGYISYRCILRTLQRRYERSLSNCA